MKKLDSPIKDKAYLAYRWMSPIMDPLRLMKGILGYPIFLKDMYDYSKMAGAESIEFSNTYPILNEKTSETPFDSHYFYQDIWAFKKIFKSKPKKHYDVGSNIEFVGFLTAFTKVEFIDIRPLRTDLDNFECIRGSILALPFESGSVLSLSCLHVAEHIGLGRYGDPLDPKGTKKACRELSRILAKGGSLYFSLPVGKPRICFNAHRVHSPRKIISYFKDLKLIELSGIDDNGKYIENIDIKTLESSNYACGLFLFKKK